VHFDSYSGDFDSEVPIAFRSPHRRNFTAMVGTGPGRILEFHTFSGNVRVRK